MYDSMFFPQWLCCDACIRAAQLERPDVVSRIFGVGMGWDEMGGVQHTTDSPGTALMYPPARQQYAIHSAVTQSFALQCQMVSPMIRLMHDLALRKVLGLEDEMFADLKQYF